MSDGMVQLYVPTELSIPALTTSPRLRVAGVAPWSNVMVTVPVWSAEGSHTMSKVEPAATVWS